MNSDRYDLGLLSANRPGVVTFTHSVAGFSAVRWQGRMAKNLTSALLVIAWRV